MSLRATAEAPANLAFVKYWGKKDSDLRLPANNSISVNLSQARTITTVDFVEDLGQDQVFISGKEIPSDLEFARRVSQHLDRIRKLAGVNFKAIIQTKNSFPTGVGIASSASGFAALTVAGCAALHLELSEKEISGLARLGSGSACRSIPDGFVEWVVEDADKQSYAVQIAPPDHWEIKIVTVIISKESKELSSTSGHSLAVASPFYSTRLAGLDQRLQKVRSAIHDRDFESFGRETELEAISFHTIAMTSSFATAEGWQSGAYYWLPESLELILAVQSWRKQGLGVYFTLDAGATVHLICLQKDLEPLLTAIKEVETRCECRKWDVLVHAPAIGARIIAEFPG